jgi:hypothetical protein
VRDDVDSRSRSHYHCYCGVTSQLIVYRFSVGIDETARLYEQQHRLKESGYPYYDKLSKGIGRTEAVQVWVRKTIDADDFLTQIELSHSDPANALHKVILAYLTVC